MKRLSVVVLLMWSLVPCVSAAQGWKDVFTPAPGPPRVVGSYTAGCLQGALELPQEGNGFQTMRRSRRRFYGHPTLLRYVQDLGEAATKYGWGVLHIGDLGQARGGPMPSGHRSHQSGLDVDIWFWLRPGAGALSAQERETMSAHSVLSNGRRTLDPSRWSSQHTHMLQVATAPAVVSRIFVNPVIKRALCDQAPGAPWLHKLRPWWGHDDHFHVRLHCPAGDTACAAQEPIAAGDGCGADLAWWFTEEARKPQPSGDGTPTPLPAACEKILLK